MPIRILNIGPAERERIAAVIDYARKNRSTLAQLKDRFDRQERGENVIVTGELPGHRCDLPIGFRVVYSEEEQPIGWCRHLSVSVDAVDKTPNMKALEFIMAAFGFRNAYVKHPEILVFVEPLSTGIAVNLIELLESELKIVVAGNDLIN